VQLGLNNKPGSEEAFWFQLGRTHALSGEFVWHATNSEAGKLAPGKEPSSRGFGTCRYQQNGHKDTLQELRRNLKQKGR